MAYRIYVTDALKMLTENTARQVSDGKYYDLRWWDALNKKSEEKSAEEIAEEILKGIGGEENESA
jgi:phosphoribosylformylglycinamidine (FGAM) synthase PurS component